MEILQENFSFIMMEGAGGEPLNVHKRNGDIKSGATGKICR